MKEVTYSRSIEETSIEEGYFSVIESLLFVSGEPLEEKSLASILECSEVFISKILSKLIDKYDEDNTRGVKIIKVNNAYQMVTKQENSEFIQKLLNINVRQSLSQAALETLAIVVYKQPITRVEIDEIRGVKSDRALSTLMEKKLIKESGRKEVPGRPILYSTTKEFLKYFDLQNIESLPTLEQLTIDDL
nr:SMC-Scp complex subunit ScpB [Clostridium collagenovorans]